MVGLSNSLDWRNNQQQKDKNNRERFRKQYVEIWLLSKIQFKVKTSDVEIFISIPDFIGQGKVTDVTYD